MTSRNIKIVGKGEVECVREPLERTKPAPGEALIQNEVSLISTGTELSRVYAIKKGLTYPIYPGYATIGRVVAAGEGMEHLQEGDRVLCSGAHKELQFCRMGNSSLEMLVKIGEEPDSISASLIHLGLIAMNAPSAANIKLGDGACVFGLGTIGLLAALLCQAAGARVLGVDTDAKRVEHAKNAGLKHVLCAEGDRQVEAVRSFFQPVEGADLTIDASGHSAAIQNAVLSTGTDGQVVLLGSPRSEYVCDITPMLNHIHMKMITVTGAFNGRFPFYKKEGSRESIQRNIATISRLMNEDVIDAQRIISHVIKPEEAPAAYEGLMYHRDEYHCVVIDWR